MSSNSLIREARRKFSLNRMDKYSNSYLEEMLEDSKKSIRREFERRDKKYPEMTIRNHQSYSNAVKYLFWIKIEGNIKNITLPRSVNSLRRRTFSNSQINYWTTQLIKNMAGMCE